MKRADLVRTFGVSAIRGKRAVKLLEESPDLFKPHHEHDSFSIYYYLSVSQRVGSRPLPRDQEVWGY